MIVMHPNAFYTQFAGGSSAATAPAPPSKPPNNNVTPGDQITIETNYKHTR